MRPGETLVLLTNVLTFIVLAFPRLRAMQWTGYLAPIALLIAVAQMLVEGARWQMLPAYVLSGLFVMVWLWPGLATASALINWLATRLGIAVLVISAALPTALPVFHFPQPSGPYAIGTLTYHWVDADRPEIFSPDPSARREFMTQIWYPATVDVSP